MQFFIGVIGLVIAIAAILFADVPLVNRAINASVLVLFILVMAYGYRRATKKHKVTVVAWADYENSFLTRLLLDLTWHFCISKMNFLPIYSNLEDRAVFTNTVRNNLNNNKSDYIIYIPWGIHPGDKEEIDEIIRESKSKIIVIGTNEDFDNCRNGQICRHVGFREELVVGHLRNLSSGNHTKYKLVYLPEDDNLSTVSNDRKEALGIRECIAISTVHPRSGALQGVATHIARKGPMDPTVFICANGEIALGCDDALQRVGCDDHVVFSFDQLPEIRRRFDSDNSCIRMYAEQSPEALAKVIVDLIENDPKGKGDSYINSNVQVA